MKKALSLLITFALLLVLVPAACADNIDVFFSTAADVAAANGNGVTVEYSRFGRLAILKEYADGIQDLLDLALAGYPSGWTAFVDAVLEEYNEVADYAASVVGTDFVLVYSIVSDADPSTTVLLISEGTVLYDAGTGVNLLGIDG